MEVLDLLWDGPLLLVITTLLVIFIEIFIHIKTFRIGPEARIQPVWCIFVPTQSIFEPAQRVTPIVRVHGERQAAKPEREK